MTLEVEFKNGAIYQYYNVPVYIHQEFMEAVSKGGFINYIVPAYACSRV
jgi:hypothetical protein